MEELTDTFNNISIAEQENNEDNELIDDFANMGLNNNNTFGKIEWWAAGIRNINCTIIDDEDFAYSIFTLPNSIFKELTNSGMNSYLEYFDAFCCNTEELFLDNTIVFKTAEIFDNIFSKRLINFDEVSQLMSSANYQLIQLISEDSPIYEYSPFTYYVQDLITGLFMLMDMLKYYSDNFDASRYQFMISLLNNYCVVVIFLKFYFESTIVLGDVDKIIIR
jgi:hypothetical protein